MAARPLPDGDDPQPGIKRADAREGLFGIFEKDQLIGGFGIRHRNFDGTGSDNFMPYGSQMLYGHLVYGLVLKPESRGQRRWQLAMCEILRWFPEDGLYFITQHHQRGREVPYVIEGVGHADSCTAFRYRFPKAFAVAPRFRSLLENSWRSLEELTPRQELATKELELVKQSHHAAELQEMVNEISRELEHLAARKNELEQQVIAMRGEHGQTERTLEAVIYSTSWRWTHPARLLGVQARTGWRKLKSFVRWPRRPSNP